MENKTGKMFFFSWKKKHFEKDGILQPYTHTNNVLYVRARVYYPAWTI